MTTLRSLVEASQRVLLKVGYALPRWRRDQPRNRIMVGLEENAGMLNAVASALPNSVSVKINTNPYYAHSYDHDLSGLNRFVRVIAAPLLLGRLTHQLEAAFYIGGAGFLLGFDGREAEFDFLDKHGVKIFCLFTGTDIRSFERMSAISVELDRDVITTYQGVSNAAAATPRAELRRKALAASADRYATTVFNPLVDQASYLTKPTEPFLYFHPDAAFASTSHKWDATPNRLTVLHAPSSPTIKGTPLVRAAVKALKEDGYDFEYVELTGLPHHEVLTALGRAHIVLNEFYALVPGVFGVEAMASRAVLLTAADPEIETTLGSEAADAWIVTPYWRIREKLQWALDHPDELPQLAEQGHRWAKEHCSATACAHIVTAQLND